MNHYDGILVRAVERNRLRVIRLCSTQRLGSCTLFMIIRPRQGKARARVANQSFLICQKRRSQFSSRSFLASRASALASQGTLMWAYVVWKFILLFRFNVWSNTRQQQIESRKKEAKRPGQAEPTTDAMAQINRPACSASACFGGSGSSSARNMNIKSVQATEEEEQYRPRLWPLRPWW